MDGFNRVMIIRDPDIIDPNNFDAKRPYYRIRGPSVTEQQAFEIIRRTDHVINNILGYHRAKDLGYISSQHVYNNWFSKNAGRSPEGWCHPTGIIGCNSHTSKYPDLGEYIGSLIKLPKAFPFLNMIMAVTDWNEMPPYAWDVLFSDSTEKSCMQAFYMEYPNFIENIEIGFWIHNGVLNILNKARAQQVYREYEVKYEEPNKDMYVSGYYNDRHIFPANYEFLKRIIVAYGLDPDKELEHYYFKNWLEGKPEPKKDSDDSSKGNGI